MNKDKLIQKIDDELEHHIAVKINASSLTVSTYHEGAIFGLKLAKQFIQSEPEEACEGCKHERKAGDEYPCSNCKRCWCDKYEKAGE